MTQEDLARAANRKLLTISNIERGVTADPKVETLSAIARALDVTLEWLMEGDEPSAESSAVELDSDPVVEAVIAEEDCTPEEAAALRSANWKLVAGANYGPDFIRRVLLARRRPKVQNRTHRSTLHEGRPLRLPAAC